MDDFLRNGLRAKSNSHLPNNNTLIPVRITQYCCVFAVLSTIMQLYLTRNFNLRMRHGIPYAKPWPFVGNIKDSALQNLDVGPNLKQIYDEHKHKPYHGFFSFDQPHCWLMMLERDSWTLKTLIASKSNCKHVGALRCIQFHCPLNITKQMKKKLLNFWMYIRPMKLNDGLIIELKINNNDAEFY